MLDWGLSVTMNSLNDKTPFMALINSTLSKVEFESIVPEVSLS